MKTLLELQHHFQFTTDKQVHHFYLKEYDTWFANYKYRTGKLLELGVSTGGSLNLWCKYFPYMDIIGVDRNPYGSDAYGHLPEGDHRIQDPRMTFYQKDVYDAATVDFLYSMYGKRFDIIIDDGSHDLKDQIFVLKEYPRLLNQYGLLIIEDIPRKNIISILQACYTHLTPKLFRLTLIDNNNARQVPPDRYLRQNYGNVPLERSTSDDSILCIEFF